MLYQACVDSEQLGAFKIRSIPEQNFLHSVISVGQSHITAGQAQQQENGSRCQSA